MSAYPNPRPLADIQADIAAGNNIPEPQIFIDLLVALAATQTSSGRQKVEPLGKLGQSRNITVTTTSAEVTLTETCRRVRLTATVNTDYRIGTGTIGAAVATDHLLLAGTSIDLCVDANSKVAAIRDASATADGVLAITELVEP